MLFTVIMIGLSSCDIDSYKDSYDTAVIYVGGEWITVEVDSWSYDGSCGRIIINTKEDKNYLVDSMNVILIDTDNN